MIALTAAEPLIPVWTPLLASRIRFDHVNPNLSRCRSLRCHPVRETYSLDIAPVIILMSQCSACYTWQLRPDMRCYEMKAVCRWLSKNGCYGNDWWLLNPPAGNKTSAWPQFALIALSLLGTLECDCGRLAYAQFQDPSAYVIKVHGPFN